MGVSCAKVQNGSKLGLEGQRLEAKEEVGGVSLVQGTFLEVDRAVWVPGLGLKGLVSAQISTGVENVFGSGLEGWRLEAKEQGVGVGWG